MIDMHAHVVPGIDDGPAHVEESAALASAAVEAGTRVMVATPHIDLHFSVQPVELAGRVAALAAELERRRIPLDVRTGGELAPVRALDLSDDELRAIALGGGSCVLLECPFTPDADLVRHLVAHLQVKGFRVLLGHPERSPAFLRDAARLVELVEGGAYVQITASSLGGRFGRRVKSFSRGLLDRGYVHVVASDAHDAAGRGPAVLPVLDAALHAARLPAELAGWLTVEVPTALLDDAPVPRPPDYESGRRLRLRRR